MYNIIYYTTILVNASVPSPSPVLSRKMYSSYVSAPLERKLNRVSSFRNFRFEFLYNSWIFFFNHWHKRTAQSGMT